MPLCICSGRQFEETFEKAFKCNQCDFASVQAGNLRTHLKTHSGEKHTNAINATLHLFRQTIWGDSWKKRTNATICNFASIHAGDLRKHLKTPSGEKSFKCNQCDFPSVQAGDFRKHVKTPLGEKAYKCNQCDFASVRADKLRRRLKKAYKCNQCNFAS